MSEPIQLCGPFYVELAYEVDGQSGADQIRTAYIDGIASEADAWRTCGRLRVEPAAAISGAGESVSVAPDQLLQMIVGRTAKAAFPFAAE